MADLPPMPSIARDWILWLLDRDPEYAARLIRWYERQEKKGTAAAAAPQQEDGDG